MRHLNTELGTIFFLYSSVAYIAIERALLVGTRFW